MDTKEVLIDKRLAKFEGLNFLRVFSAGLPYFYHGEDLHIPENNNSHSRYTRSIDACLPIIKKLDESYEITFGHYSDGREEVYFGARLSLPNLDKYINTKGKTEALALSAAIYEALEELENEH